MRNIYILTAKLIYPCMHGTKHTTKGTQIQNKAFHKAQAQGIQKNQFFFFFETYNFRHVLLLHSISSKGTFWHCYIFFSLNTSLLNEEFVLFFLIYYPRKMKTSKVLEKFPILDMHYVFYSTMEHRIFLLKT